MMVMMMIKNVHPNHLKDDNNFRKAEWCKDTYVVYEYNLNQTLSRRFIERLDPEFVTLW